MGEKAVKSLRTAEYERLTGELKALRIKAGYSQKEICLKLGQDITYVSKVERGTRRLDLIEFLDLLQALDQDPGQFVDRFWKSKS